MTKINIKDLELNIDIVHILNLYSLKSPFFIDIKGNIYRNENELKNNPVIYKIVSFKDNSSLLDAKALTLKLFTDYKPSISGTICKIKPVVNWQNIIDMNKEYMLYFDHQSDGVELFEDKELEDFGWHASALDINYRTISEFIEDNCEGTLLFYDNTVQFNGFAIIDDITDTRKKVKEFIIAQTKKNIEDSIIDLDDEDVIEALEFFDIKA